MFVFFIALTFLNIALISYGFFMSVFFDSSSIGGAVAALMWFCLNIPCVPSRARVLARERPVWNDTVGCALGAGLLRACVACVHDEGCYAPKAEQSTRRAHRAGG